MLLELTRVLGEYDEEIAVVGGWVPPLLMPEAGHIGSTDVDLLAGKKRQSQAVQDLRA